MVRDGWLSQTCLVSSNPSANPSFALFPQHGKKGEADESVSKIITCDLALPIPLGVGTEISISYPETVNAELQSKLDDLSRVNNDMTNLLNSTEIATVFLDGKLNVRRFTEPATKIIKLIPGDVGRPLSDLVTDLDYTDLSDDAQDVLRTLVFSEKQVATRDGRWFTVRIMPYRTTDNVIDGLVITCIDISAAKELETKLRLKSSPGKAKR